MRRITPVLLLAVMIQLTAAVEISVAKLFPKAPTKAFGIRLNWSDCLCSQTARSWQSLGVKASSYMTPETLAQVAHLAGEFGAPSGPLLLVPMAHCLPQRAEMPRFDCGTSPPTAQIHAFTGHNAGVRSVDFSPDGTFLTSASSDGTVRVWQP